ncbi:MAG TPA: hypothetical protein VHB70_19750 [Parafilimonas sp.]|nr:hypothetical protein [Parafilimonas sp.]
MKPTALPQSLLKFIFCICFFILTSKIHAQDLNGVTFGFSSGYSLLNHHPNDYSLSPDTNHTLQIQTLSKGSFVISSVVSVKLGKLALADVTTRNGKKIKSLVSQNNVDHAATFWNRVSINASLDLLNVKSDNVTFNTKVNGGIGLGYFLTENIQIAAFYDVQTVRQLRDYIINKYLNQRIPNGSAYYNALDQNDNTLFYNKTFGGWSLKLIFSLANKKAG